MMRRVERDLDALAVVARVVRAVVEHDDAAITGLSPESDDLYVWTRDYGEFGEVELMMPPGEPESWDVDWTELDDGGRHAAVTMWTRQDGRSDLTLEMTLEREGGGGWSAGALGLHVL